MLANTPDVDGSTRKNRPLPEERPKGDFADEGSVGLPVRRVGLEQEFFLVDRRGALRDLADTFLQQCWEEALTEGLDPRCFKTECVKSSKFRHRKGGTVKAEQDQNLSTDEGAPGATTEPMQTAASHQQRRERGRAARRVAPRDSHAE